MAASWITHYALDIFLMVIFALGICGGTNKDKDLLSCYRIGLLIVILALLGFVIFGYVAVEGIDLNLVKAHEYTKDYKSGWLRDRVADPHYWARASSLQGMPHNFCPKVIGAQNTREG
ncbi:hypothetical protein E2562_009216 [Oryza meyeriana var. granulata]|uniref:Uncharacterized protein n=1 Tax=Oryza meyeriana var. granulata TaxID=110450 RepID=A0A6G1D1B6_9ORYZ|nr:hypothetical protein E2562_009216 [Oryza meyeriana var. granulata]